ncbi:universal stress protein [Halomarina litorea]|uniref:universal stress protein n=1 Tax=Halomarina litorea TaxID=2961595 RepID=UPI0020C2653E|nr:universal stress protein [Halomarina sp. BCD28]
MMYDRIVIPVDGSEEAERAARRGLELARRFGAAADVLYVADRAVVELGSSADETDRLREVGGVVLAEVETFAADLGVPTTTTLLEGDPTTQICEYVRDRDASLVVLGGRPLAGLGRRLLGGVSERVLHRSDVPVLVVPSGEGDRAADYERVLLLTDGSEESRAGVRHAVAFAECYGASVDVLNVVDLQAASGVFAAGGLDEAFVERLEARGQRSAGRFAADVEDLAPSVSVDSDVVTTRSFEGVAPAIREYVEERDVDLVVTSTHGRSNVGRHLRGSVASSLFRTLDVPVLVVRRGT